MDATRQVNIYEAKTGLSRLVADVERGATVVLCRDGKPVARIVPYAPEPRPFGVAKGEITLREGWDAPDDLFADYMP